MIKKFFLSVFLTVSFGLSIAQTSKPDVLVIGNGNAAVAAAIQSAISGVKTTLLLQAGGFDIAPLSGDMHSGIQADFIKKIQQTQQIQDSSLTVSFDKQLANNVLTKWTDSIQNLTVIRNVRWTKADAYTNSWLFKLSNDSSIRAKVLINSGDLKLNEALKIKINAGNSYAKLDYEDVLYRTSIAAGKFVDGTTTNYFSLYKLLVPERDNLIWINDAESMLIGQAGGATAAYAAFYGFKTSQSNLKKIQGELINYNLALMPFYDVLKTNSNWKAIQFVGITGLLKADIKDGKAMFNPKQLVNTAEIKQPLKDFYYKAQIWFDDYKEEIITIGSAVDMICYVGNKALDETKKGLEKKWKTNYGFATTFDLSRQINREELTAILQDYMPPFNVNVDKTGKVVR